MNSLIESINELCKLIPEWNKVEMDKIREKIINDIKKLYRLDKETNK